LGACQEITTKAFANAMGVPLTRVSVQLKGHIDLRGFFAVDDSVRAGFNKILGLVCFFFVFFLGREQNDPGRKLTCLKYRMHFGAQSPWKYVVRRLRWENVGI